MGDVTTIEVEAGLVDEYYVVSVTPNDGSNDGPKLINANLTLSGLTPGEEYTLELGSSIDACSGVVSTTNITYRQCTS